MSVYNTIDLNHLSTKIEIFVPHLLQGLLATLKKIDVGFQMDGYSCYSKSWLKNFGIA